VLHLRGGGWEKKKPRRDTSSSGRRDTEGDDLADHDYETEEESGSKRKPSYKPRSKWASNVARNPLPPTSEANREDDDDDDEEEEEEDEEGE